MEILTLVLLYYLSQNPYFSESVKPLMCKIKDSEEMLRFLNDLSKFAQTFTPPKTEEKSDFGSKKQPSPAEEDKKNPQSPTKGIADEFIENILQSYLKKH